MSVAPQTPEKLIRVNKLTKYERRMKIEFIENTPHIIPESQNEEDQLFDWYEKVKGKRVDAVISFEWLPRAVAKSSDEQSNCIKHAVSGLLPFTDVLELNICIEKLNTKQITLEEFVSDVWNTAYRIGYDMASEQ
jgi:hypothetical protein